MAINTRKISGLPELVELSGSEYLMVSNNNKSYKVKTSLLTSDIIKSIEQELVQGDGKDNPITITTSSGDVYQFSIKNGLKGSTGATGKKGEKGEKGNSGVALTNVDTEDVINLIVDSLNGDGHTDEELAEMILSAKQGAILNTKLDKLKEVFCTQDQFDTWVEEGKIDDTTKYFIIEENE